MERRGVSPVLMLLVYHVAAELPINDCGEPPPSANTYRTFPDNSTVEYRCIDTYILSSGDLVRHCVDGKYNGTSPICSLTCGPPLNTSYASINSTGSKEGDTVTYTCPDGWLVSSTNTECNGKDGYWLAGDRCFANVSLDIAALTAVQTSTATLNDIRQTTITPLSLSLTTTFDAANALDPTKLGVSLLTGDCSSTGLEQRPNMTVTLDNYYTIYQVAVTLPDDDFAFSLPNLKIGSSTRHQTTWQTCMKHKGTIPFGSRFVATCKGTRYPVHGKYLLLEVDFGGEPGMLQICQIEVYGHPLTSVDCGQPPAVPFAVITTQPSSTHYASGNEAVTYECIDGYTKRNGKGTGYCHANGYWIINIKCTADKNLSHRKPVSLSNNDTIDVSQLTDGNTSSCTVLRNVTEATFVIDLGKDTEVSDVSITFYEAEMLKNAYTEVSVRRDGYHESICDRSTYMYTTRRAETKNVVCSYFPVGRYVSVHHVDDDDDPIAVCEIMVHGRPYTEVLECYGYDKQATFKGHMNTTVAGIPCQRWDSQSPHAHSHTDISKFPDDNLEDAANYCRNPDGKYGLWCYTNDPDVEWQYCPVRSCDRLCLQDDKDFTYRGHIKQTSSGASCVKWNVADIPFRKNSYFPNSWRNSAKCRNPVLSQSRPWCYTSTDASQYGLCDIPTSCPTAAEMSRGHWVLDAHQTLDDLSPSTECLVWNTLYTAAGTFSGTWDKAFTPKLYRNTFTSKRVCHEEKVFNTTILCFNITESGTIWKAGILECVHCGSPHAVDNATVSISSKLLNGTATYTCVTGYEHASGSNKVTCLKTGQWEDPDMVCLVNCGDPPSVNRTEVSSTNGFVSETVEYTCKPGYAHVSGSTSITCLDTGKWEDAGIHCEVVVDCSSPPVVANTVVITDNTTLNSTAVYICTPGFTHVTGSNNVTCLNTGVWETPVIECVEIALPLTMTSPTPTALPVTKYERTTYEACTCRCLHKEQVDQEDIVKQITKTLILNTHSLKSYTMTKGSLADERKSSKGIAYIAMSVMGLLFGVVFLSDMYYFINGITGYYSARR